MGMTVTTVKSGRDTVYGNFEICSLFKCQYIFLLNKLHERKECPFIVMFLFHSSSIPSVSSVPSMSHHSSRYRKKRIKFNRKKPLTFSRHYNKTIQSSIKVDDKKNIHFPSFTGHNSLSQTARFHIQRLKHKRY